ncbi:MAG: DUF5989 family protein [Mariniblastus sp.]|nr:DUF5989 family protein [Mariniblastus sp.]
MKNQSKKTPQDGFEFQSQSRPPGIVSEFFDFLIHNKKWWLTPIILILMLFSVFIILTNTAIGPFIYIFF